MFIKYMFLELMIGSKLVAGKGNAGMIGFCYRCNGRVNEINRFWCNFMVFLVWEWFVGTKSGHDKGVQY